MTGVSKAEHAKLRVEDIDEAYEFYTDVMGLKEIDRRGEIVYLGCGYDSNFDLAIEEGGTGIDHFAVRVENEEKLDEFEDRLRAGEVDVQRHNETEPNVQEAIGFDLPSGHSMELVLVEDTAYRNAGEPRTPQTSGIVPTDLDHHTIFTTDIEADMEFLKTHLGFNVSDIVENENEEVMLAFTRYGDFHHDVGMIRTEDPDTTLNHLGWQADSADHMKRFIDNLAQVDIRLEIGISRHNVGDNVFAYFWEPGGNRFEISTEMATLNESTPTKHRTVTGFMGQEDLSAWGGIDIPETMTDGS
jgi:catechol 2,3-dioxygenase